METSSASLVLGVDVGGTNVRVGVVKSAESRILRVLKSKTRGLSLQRFCGTLADAIPPFRGRIAGIGIAVPGFCDAESRRVITTCGIVPFLEACDLARAVENHLGIKTVVDNDARAHAMGEYYHGGWRKVRSLVVITLGTGVGLAWWVEGRLYPPPNHGATGGHLVVSPSGGNPCYCGATGCLESLASATALAAAANERLARLVPSELRGPVSAEQVCRAGRTDPLAHGCVTRAIESLRGALHTLRHLYFPDVVVLGGGMAPGLWPYMSELRSWFRQMERYDGRRNRLVLSHLGDKAAMLGAAALARTRLPGHPHIQ